MIDIVKKSPFFFLIYIVSLLLCFVVFKQSDLTHTYTSSYAYLGGHIYDFYDYNKPYMIGNDYLPLMYIIFALWSIPLKLLNLLTPAEMGLAVWQISTPLEIVWAKLLLSIFFIGCIAIIQKITELIDLNKQTGTVNSQILFATSPIVIFAVFIFSQYDIFGVFFTLLGIFFYFKKKFLYFALFFSIAISFKYFACFIYLPLVLLVEKRPMHIIKYGLLGCSVTALQIGAYWHSEIFQNSFFSLAGEKTVDAAYRGKALYIAISYILLCCYAFFSKIQLTLKEKSWPLNTILICTLAYALMFLFVRWHPQWILILMPFFALVVPLIRHQKLFISYEILAYIAFIWLCVNGWVKNVDVTMLQEGIIGEYIPKLTYFGSDVLLPKGVSLARIIFNIYLFSPFIFWIYENKAMVKAKTKLHFAKIRGLEVAGLSGHDLASDQKVEVTSFAKFYLARIIVGGYFFLSLSFICLYLSI